MKTATVLFTTVFSASCLAFSVNPTKLVNERVYLDIFSGKYQRDGSVKVGIKKYNSDGLVSASSRKVYLPREEYDNLLAHSQAVYKMEPSDEEKSRGTAFHIGHNLVLTNSHVLSPSKTNLTKCDYFRLTDNSSRDSYTCKKVHHCDLNLDLCLIEMNSSSFRRKQLNDGPRLKLSRTFSPSDTMIMTAIGNSQGLGIHVSQGYGAVKVGSLTTFYAPVTNGNSGGALLDEEFSVVGLVRSQSDERVGPNAYNRASSMDSIVKHLREKLKDNPETLEKFNEAVIQ